MAPLELLAGDGAAAARELRDAIAILDRVGNRGPIANMEAMLTGALLAEGLVDEAEEHARRARDLAFSTAVGAQALWRGVTARVLARRGEIEEAMRLASESIDLLDGSQEILALTDMLVGQAEVLELADRPDEAAAARARAVALLEAKGATAAARRAGRPSRPSSDSARAGP
jgi:tetratricopeptide (TPR) repeat protein